MNLEIFNDLIVVKRSGQRVNFNGPKIAIAIKHAFDSIHDIYNEQNVNQVYQAVLEYIKINYKDRKTINVEDIQDIIENVLQQKKYTNVYLSFNNYRLKRAASREAFNVKQQHKFVKAIEKIGLKVKSDSNQTPMEKILDFGKIISNEFSKAYLLESKYIRAHEEGSIFIHDINYYTLGITSASVLDFSNYDLNDNNEMIDEIIETIKNIKKEQYGEHIIPNLDLVLQKRVLNNFKNLYKTKLINYLTIKGFVEYINVNFLEKCIDKLGEINFDKNILNSFIKSTEVQELFNKAYDDAYEDLKKGLNKNIYKMLTKLNQLDNMINNNQTIIMLGNNTSIEGQLIIESYLNNLSLLPSLDNVKTIFKIDSNNKYLISVLKLIKLNKNIEFIIDDHNYFNNKYLGKIVLSTTTINLARLGLKYNLKELNSFYQELSDVMELTKNQLLQRYELQANKYNENFKYLFKNNLLIDAEKLEDNQKIRKVLRHGILRIGFVGLLECVKSILEETKESSSKQIYDLSLDILMFMNNKIKDFQNDNKLDFELEETNNYHIKKELKALDKSIYGTKIINKKEIYEQLNTIYKGLSLKEILKITNLVNDKIIIPKTDITQQKIIDLYNNMIKENIKYGLIKIE